MVQRSLRFEAVTSPAILDAKLLTLKIIQNSSEVFNKLKENS